MQLTKFGMYIPDWDIDRAHEMWNVDTYQDGLITDIMENIPTSDRRVALDLGSNVGYTAIKLAGYFDQVFAFEPCPEVYECLETNTKPYSDIVCHNVAIWNTTGRVKMRMGNVSGHSHISQIKQERYVPGRDRLVNITTLNKYKFDRIDFIKMDIQGAEYDVIRYHKDLLSKHKPTLVIEDMNNIENVKTLLLNIGYILCYRRRKDYIFLHHQKVIKTFELLPLHWRHKDV